MLQLSRDAGVRLVDPAAWSFQVGGYHVMQRWLQVRRGRQLSTDDLRYLAWLGEVAATTKRLTGEIDLALPS
jgi:hypothetical protein